MNSQLGKLQQVDLRKAWSHEALDFTRWLAEPENLSLLSDEIGIEIKHLQTEASVGDFNVDILAEEESSGRKIIIENQLEATNHDHLGKIITYASGYDAEIIIWIVKGARDEHKQAIDWLNEHTDEKIYFFLVKMELWQIGNSPYAPKFYIVSQPNDWAKAVKKSASESELSDTKLRQMEFWNRFRDHCKNMSSKLRLQKAQPQHWFNVALGSSYAHISLTINSQENQLGCEIYIPNNKDLYYSLEKEKSNIEKELDSPLEWMPLEGKKASRIKLVTAFNFEDMGTWDQPLNWSEKTVSNFQKVFFKYIKKI